MQKLLNPPESSGLHRRGLRNGGFPVPLPEEPTHEVAVEHAECGFSTRIVLPSIVSAQVVRRVLCDGCGGRYMREADVRMEPVVAREPIVVEALVPDRAKLEVTADEPQGEPVAGRPRSLPRMPQLSLSRLSLPKLPKLSRPSAPRLSIPSIELPRLIAAPLIVVAVVFGMHLIGSRGTSEPGKAAQAEKTSAPAGARFVRRATYSMALPRGWRSVPARGGADFQAVDPYGYADATLWVERNPSLSFRAFENRSLAHLKTLSPEAKVFQRLAAPAGESSIVQLRADVPTEGGSAPYLVTLRSLGPNRYYLATSVDPEAPTSARKAAALIHGSFMPQAPSAGE